MSLCPARAQQVECLFLIANQSLEEQLPLGVPAGAEVIRKQVFRLKGHSQRALLMNALGLSLLDGFLSPHDLTFTSHLLQHSAMARKAGTCPFPRMLSAKVSPSECSGL